MTRKLADGRVFTDYEDEAWQAGAFRLILIAFVAGSFAAGPAVLRWALGARWPGYVIPVGMVCAAVGILTTTALGRPAWRGRRGSAFRLGEMLLIVMAARVLVWSFSEGLPGLADIRSWFLQPWNFFTGEFLFAAIVWLVVWAYAVRTMSDFLELAIQPDEVAARQSHEWGDSRSQWRAGAPVARLERLQGFAVRWIGFGIVFVICAGLTQIDLSTGESGRFQVALRGLGLRSEVVICLVCYFLAGLVLLSHGRLAVLRGRWYNQGVEVGESFIRRWHVNSLAFIGLMALLALLLPLGSTSWLMVVVDFVYGWLVRLMLVVGLFLSGVLAFIVALLSRLFGTPQPVAPEPLPEPLNVLPQVEVVPEAPAWVGSAVLWLVVTLVTVFLLINFLRVSGLLETKWGKQLIALRLWWRARWARASTVLITGMTGLRKRLRRARRRVPRPNARDVERAGPLLPRDHVRRYYLRAVREAGEEGVVRGPHQTPLEFEEDLRAEWPETVADARELTEVFLDARYSAHEIGDREVSSAESAWRRLVRRIREARQ